MIKQTTFDKIITDNLLNTLRDIDHLKQCWLAYQGNDNPEQKLADLAKKERKEEEKKKRLINAISEGIIELSEAKTALTEIKNTIQALQAERDSLIDKQTDQFDFDAVSLTRSEFSSLDLPDKRNIIHAAIERIDFYKNYALITYRFPRTINGDRTSRVNLPPPEK